MPLSEKVRIELFIPDLPDPIYFNLLEQLGDELSYAFGGRSVVPASGKRALKNEEANPRGRL